jgi:DNA-binding MarR family transcriptional regulator
VAGFISESWPGSNRNGGRHQIGIPGRIASEFARLPSPAVPTIAKAIGLKTRAVQKRLRKLEALKFIERHPRPLASKNNETNLYSFNGLIAAATPYAQEALEAKAKAIEAKKKRLESKKPKLVVNNPKT